MTNLRVVRYQPKCRRLEHRQRADRAGYRAAPIKDNDAALRMPRERGCSSASTSARSPASTSKSSQVLLGTRASVDQRGVLTLRRRTYPAAYCDGLTTAAEPPPRRTGSAAASTCPSWRNSTPVAAPISAIVENVWPNAISSATSGRAARNAGSAYNRRRVPLTGPRRRDGLGQRHAEVDPVDEDLEHGRDDHRAARANQWPGTACRA